MSVCGGVVGLFGLPQPASPRTMKREEKPSGHGKPPGGFGKESIPSLPGRTIHGLVRVPGRAGAVVVGDPRVDGGTSG